MRTILAADLDLRPDTAAKIATMEAIIAPVREGLLDLHGDAMVLSPRAELLPFPVEERKLLAVVRRRMLHRKRANFSTASKAD